MNLTLFARSTLLSTLLTLTTTAKAQALTIPAPEPLYKDPTYIIAVILQAIPLATLLGLILLVIITKGKPIIHRLAAVVIPFVILVLNSTIARDFSIFTTYTKFPIVTYPALLVTGTIISILTTLAILKPSIRKKAIYLLILSTLIYILTIFHAGWYNQQNYQRMIDSGWLNSP